MLVGKELSKTFEIKEKNGLFKKASYKKKQAVEAVNISIEEGKIVGLLGVNGAGKTTTIKMLAGLIEPTEGSIVIDDINIVKNHKEAKKFINIISGGERNIYWRLTAKENLEYFGALYGINNDKLQPKIDELLKKVKLDDVKDVPVERYSKGMKQRLQIARGLINDPKYVFLDEPTLGLDINIAKELREYIKDLSKVHGKGVLLTTHYIYEAEELCDYIYIIDNGRIVSEGTPEELKNSLKFKMKTIINVDSCDSILDEQFDDLRRLGNIDIGFNDNSISINSNKNYISEVMKILSENNVNVNELKIIEPNLEEVLLSKISGGVYE